MWAGDKATNVTPEADVEKLGVGCRSLVRVKSDPHHLVPGAHGVYENEFGSAPAFSVSRHCSIHVERFGADAVEITSQARYRGASRSALVSIREYFLR